MHTKGKWYIDENLTDNGAPIIVSDNSWMGGKRRIAKVLYHNGSEDPEVQANAQLIAAAPDLLKALQDIADIGQGCVGRGIGYDAEVNHIALDAIKKAAFLKDE